MGPGPSGNQPFELDTKTLVCNGEVYNYSELKAENTKLSISL